MNTIGRIYKWIIISVMLQLVVLAYFSYIYLPGSNNVKATFYEGEEKTDRNVTLPDSAHDIKVSFNGMYAGYITDGKLEILNLKTRKSQKTFDFGGDELSYYRWLPDRNMVIYAFQSSNGDSCSAQISTFELDSEVERSYPAIKGLPERGKVTDIELSPLTNIVYVKVITSETKSRIYKFNIMDNLSSITTINSDTEIKGMNYTDTLVYGGGSKLYIRNGKSGSVRTIVFKEHIVLLNIDSEDNIYTGELNEEGNVVKVYWGKAEDYRNKEWKEIDLKNPSSPQHVMVTPNSRIYVTSETNSIYDVEGDRQIDYPGEFIGMLDGTVISKDGKALKLKVFDKKN